jgi:hypothetical protein
MEEKTLRLATNTAKGELSKKLTELAWRRLFWSRNFNEKVRLKRPSSELDYSWNKHLDTVADWSAEYMVNLNGMEEFYPHSEKSSQFQNIHQEFAAVEKELVCLRTANLDDASQKDVGDVITDSLNSLNVDLYFFVLHKRPDSVSYPKKLESAEKEEKLKACKEIK